MKTEMLRTYETLTAARAYIVGFVHDGKLYRVDTETLPEGWVKLDRAASSKGGMLKLRLRLSAAVKRELVESGAAQLVGAASLLETADRYNRGERWERLVTEAAGQTWAKDSVPFWVAGDLELNGVQVQVKLDQAEVTNERALARALALA